MPVGTQATVKTLGAEDLERLGAPIILGNSYHLMLRPGLEVMEALGGLHAFQGWRGPILTDSGGFQVFSLSSLRKITEEGGAFQSHIDGRRLFMGPKESMAVQRVLGSDIAMLFDECIPYPATPDYAARSVEQTLRWARVCLAQPRAEGQLYFGIVQGSEYPHLREHCARELAAMEADGLDGFAVGGSVGEPEPFILKGIADSVPFMPRRRPRYVMGLGDLWQITEAVGMGCDMFDCVIPTRNARNGSAFTLDGPYPVKAGAWKASDLPIEPGCDCSACHHAMAYALLALCRSHLGRAAASRHKTASRLGAAPTGHLEEAARTMLMEADTDHGAVLVRSPGFSRALGPLTIRAKRARALTIPLDRVSYGRRAKSGSYAKCEDFAKKVLAPCERGVLLCAPFSRQCGRKQS